MTPSATFRARLRSLIPTTPAELCAAALRLAGVGFTLQAPILSALYALRGWDTPPDAMPPLLRIDPLHGLLHLGLGLGSLYFGFRRPHKAVVATRVFGLIYLGLAVLGAATTLHFGMRLGIAENRFHLVVGTLMLAVGLFARPLAAWTARWAAALALSSAAVNATAAPTLDGEPPPDL